MKKIIVTLLLLFHLSVWSQGWSELNTGVSATLTSVYVSNDFLVWVCGYNGTVIKSTNSGSNWMNLTGNGIPTNVSLVNIHSNLAGDVVLTAGYVGSNTYVYRSTNGGANWTQIFTEANGFVNVIWFLFNNNWFMQGDPTGGRWSLWKSVNNGVTWDSSGLYLQQAGSEMGWNNSMYSYLNYVWFGTNNSRIYYSTNYGVNWTTQSTTPEINSYTVWFNNTSTGYTGGATLLKTTNNGLNWNMVTSSGSGNLGGFVFSAYEIYRWYVRSTNQIYGSLFNGAWTVQHTAPSGTYRYMSMRLSNPWGGYVYAVRTLGGISRTLFMIDKIKSISSEIPEKFTLYQNYPNPFNPVTKIKFDITSNVKSKMADVKLIVYDITGREVVVLVNEHLNPGTYEVVFDGSNYTSGVYFYRLITEGFAETKSMIMVK